MNHQQFCASEYGNINVMSDGFNNPNSTMKEKDRVTWLRE